MKIFLSYLAGGLLAVAAAAPEAFVSGPRAYVDRGFLPATKNALAGRLAEKVSGAAMTLEFIDETGKAQSELRPLDTSPDGSFTVGFATRADTQAVGFTLRDRAGGFPKWQVGKIRRDPGLPKFRPDCWQASWIVPPGMPGAPPRKGGTIYFVKEFDLDLSQVAKAACQYVGSNNGTACLNGVDLGRTYGWATPRAVDDVLPLLRDGKNVFGGDARIPNGSAVFMAELTLILKDGTVRHLGTGDDWRCSDAPPEGWGRPDFDHSGWPFAVCYSRPPQLPYGETRYRNFAPVPTVRLPDLPRQWRAAAGTTVKFDLTAPLTSLRRADPEVWLMLMRGDREFYRMPMRAEYADGRLRLTAELAVPPTAQSGTYTVKLESRSLIFPELVGRLTVAGGAKFPPLTAEVKNVRGTPVLHLNGRPEPMLLQRSSIDVRRSTANYRFTSGPDRAGVKLLEINLDFGRLWRKDGSVDTAELDLYVQSALFYAPHSYLVLLFNTDAPEWYLKKFPDERFVSNAGVINRISYASLRYRRDSTAFLERIVEYLKTHPCWDRIAGIGFDGGDDGQFMQWAGPGRKFVGDYGRPMRDIFHAFLRRKYGDIARLNGEWRTRYADFAEIAVPSMERRRGDARHFVLDPVKDADIIDFNRAFSACVADLISGYAATVKRLTGRTRLVAAYYGKIFSIYGILEWGEFDIERIIADPNFDYLIAVDYIARPAGKPHELIIPPASYRKHNKIFVDEADIRTFIAGPAKWAKTDTLYEFTSQARKMFIKSWVNGMGTHWYDIHGGMFDNAGLQRTLGLIRKIAEVAPDRSVPTAEIALIADEKSHIYTTYAYRHKFQPRQDSAFGRLGAPYDVWFLDDVGKPGFPEYRMYVFLNVLAPTPEQRRSIDALKRDGKLLVFLHNSGYIDGRTASAENVARLTGIKMAESGPLRLAMRFAPGDGGELFRNVRRPLFAATGEADTVAVPDDPEAVGIGSFPGNGRFKPMAYKRFPDWRSFYGTVGLLPLELWRELARAAGVHFYIDNDPDAMIYLGSDLLGIHSGAGGVKQLNFPEPRTFTDAVTGEVIAVSTRTPKFRLERGETRIFRMK